MSNPVLFFIFIIVIDLILKSVKNKKKMEDNRAEREMMPQNKPDINQQKPMQKSEPIRDIMATLRAEVEKERQKELDRRQGKTKPKENVKTFTDEQIITQKTYEDEKYWDNKRRIAEDEKVSRKTDLEKHNKIINVKEDIIRGIIFSEILSEPKSIKNQRKSM